MNVKEYPRPQLVTKDELERLTGMYRSILSVLAEKVREADWDAVRDAQQQLNLARGILLEARAETN